MSLIRVSAITASTLTLGFAVSALVVNNYDFTMPFGVEAGKPATNVSMIQNFPTYGLTFLDGVQQPYTTCNQSFSEGTCGLLFGSVILLVSLAFNAAIMILFPVLMSAMTLKSTTRKLFWALYIGAAFLAVCSAAAAWTLSSFGSDSLLREVPDSARKRLMTGATVKVQEAVNAGVAQTLASLAVGASAVMWKLFSVDLPLQPDLGTAAVTCDYSTITQSAAVNATRDTATTGFAGLDADKKEAFLLPIITKSFVGCLGRSVGPEKFAALNATVNEKYFGPAYVTVVNKVSNLTLPLTTPKAIIDSGIVAKGAETEKATLLAIDAGIKSTISGSKTSKTGYYLLICAFGLSAIASFLSILDFVKNGKMNEYAEADQGKEKGEGEAQRAEEAQTIVETI